MRIFRTTAGILIEKESSHYLIQEDWDVFVNRDDLYEHTEQIIADSEVFSEGETLINNELLPPIGSQEVWAAGVTYYKSREARMEEAKEAGGGDFYDRVYDADRPELFFKATPGRTVGSGQQVRIRKDSAWNVPEPELTLLISSGGRIVGYMAGNDMSSRDIEGKNPLYLPQAKTYDKSAAIGPGIYVTKRSLPADTTIKLDIVRNGKGVFEGEVTIRQIKREFTELVGYLYRECSFPKGCLLMTGTGIVPENEFTLDHGDEIRITIDHIGTLVNFVE